MRYFIITIILFILLYAQGLVAQQQGFGCIKNMEVVSFSGSYNYVDHSIPSVIPIKFQNEP